LFSLSRLWTADEEDEDYLSRMPRRRRHRRAGADAMDQDDEMDPNALVCVWSNLQFIDVN
jgi:hypothetical protein